MSPAQRELVQGTWARLQGAGSEVARLFYARLFELDPALRALFRTNAEEQGRRLVAMIDAAVRGLDRVEALVDTVAALGRRHAGYGVQPQHYATVGAALLWTLERGLGAAFTPDAREAWTAVYASLADIMQAAAATAPA